MQLDALSLVASNGSRPIRICLPPPPTTHGVTQAPTEQSFLSIYTLDIHLDSGKSASDGERMRGIFPPLLHLLYCPPSRGRNRVLHEGTAFGRKRKKMKMKRGVSQSASDSPVARSLGAWPLFREVLKEGRGAGSELATEEGGELSDH